MEYYYPLLYFILLSYSVPLFGKGNSLHIPYFFPTYLVIISAGFGLDAGLALTSSQYNVHSCFGMLSVLFSAGWFFRGPSYASHIRHPRPHMSEELLKETFAT